ncbi:MAG: hypothetical protein H6766_07115 [Candidatus Peribacteria bacterium]|nr:MAG: hypothetical protein H6766_07115 [Candidatus Peribacteria bacterium]
MATMQAHIVILVDYYLPHRGGIEVSVEQHIYAALEAGYRISVITSKHSEWLSEQETIQTPLGSYTVYRT